MAYSPETIEMRNPFSAHLILDYKSQFGVEIDASNVNKENKKRLTFYRIRFGYINKMEL